MTALERQRIANDPPTTQRNAMTNNPNDTQNAHDYFTVIGTIADAALIQASSLLDTVQSASAYLDAGEVEKAKTTLHNALVMAQTSVYEQVYAALPREPGQEGMG